MKTIIRCVLCGLLACFAAACSAPKKNTEQPELHKDNMKIAYLVTHLGDKSYCDSGEAGMNRLREEGYDVTTYEIGEDPSGFRANIMTAIDQNCNLILGNSNFLETLDEIAREHPEVRFVLIDVKREPEELLDNQAAVFYAQNEGSYLIGVLSAAITETGTVAIDVGKDVPVIGDFVAGFVNGVKDWNAANGTDVKVVSGTVGSWSDPSSMKAICLDQAKNSHADVFYQAAGGSGDGLFEACVQTDSWAIGVDSDQYQAYMDAGQPRKAEVILTSMIKEVGNSLINTVYAIDNKEDIWKKTKILGLAEESVGYVDNENYQKHVPAKVRKALLESAANITARRISVKSYYDFKDHNEYQEYLKSAQ